MKDSNNYVLSLFWLSKTLYIAYSLYLCILYDSKKNSHVSLSSINRLYLVSKSLSVFVR
jgi:hypothetical protein